MQKKSTDKTYKNADPMMWGGVLGLVAAVVVALSQIFMVEQSSNDLLQTPFQAAGGGFFMGWAVANYRNWVNRPY